MTRGQALLHRLVNGLRTSARVVVVVAHPDDETVSLGGALSLMPQAIIVQVTDGAAQHPTFFERAGVSTISAYRAARRRERDAAQQAAGWTHRWIDAGIPDQTTHTQTSQLAEVLLPVLAGADVVFTHPYEGGHPDHDTCACVVQRTCERLGGLAPERLEFASYHWDGSVRVMGHFWPDPDCPAQLTVLRSDALARKERAVMAYRSQWSILRRFNARLEEYRVAPIYDFTQPPSPPACWYERKQPAKLTSAEWRASINATQAEQVA